MGKLVCTHKVLPGNEKFTERGPQNLYMNNEATHLTYFLSAESMKLDKFTDEAIALWVGEWVSGWGSEWVSGLVGYQIIGWVHERTRGWAG